MNEKDYLKRNGNTGKILFVDLKAHIEGVWSCAEKIPLSFLLA